MKERITSAKRWTRDGKDVRFYIETVDENGTIHTYTRYVSGNSYHAPKTWGTDKLWNGVEEGEPSAAVIEEYKRLTNGGRESYVAPKPSAQYEPAEEEADLLDRTAPRKDYSHIVRVNTGGHEHGCGET